MVNTMYLKDGCPYCGIPLKTNNAKQHVGAKHKDKVAEFEKNYDALKASAIDATKEDVSSAKKTKEEIVETVVEEKKDMLDDLLGEDLNVEDIVPEVPLEDIKETTIHVTEIIKDEGEKKPEKGKSFLTEFNEWLDSPEF